MCLPFRVFSIPGVTAKQLGKNWFVVPSTLLQSTAPMAERILRNCPIISPINSTPWNCRMFPEGREMIDCPQIRSSTCCKSQFNSSLAQWSFTRLQCILFCGGSHQSYICPNKLTLLSKLHLGLFPTHCFLCGIQFCPSFGLDQDSWLLGNFGTKTFLAGREKLWEILAGTNF